MKQHIEDLILFELEHIVIDGRDINYVRNQIYALLGIKNDGNYPQPKRIKYPADALNPMLDELVNLNLIDDNLASRDYMDSKIMNVFAKLPSDLETQFHYYYNQKSERGTNYLYSYAKNTNYIRMDRMAKNKSFTAPSRYGDLNITINLSKPEKDPKHIIEASKESTITYPKCLLCIENEGFSGDLNRDARDQHRLIQVDLKNGPYYFQYSPYIYYNEHAIVISDHHTPMKINQKTIENLLELTDIFKGYFFGSNADLPIVGGSILSHDHYQGGKFSFPIESAKTIKSWDKDDVTFDLLYWPLSTIRLKSTQVEPLIHYATILLNAWKTYENKQLMIYPNSGGKTHQTVTPIARKKDGFYELDIILRNNYTNDRYPLGLFHPHEDKWHIKKENIGLIEAMGLAVLPARLDQELTDVNHYMLLGTPLPERSFKHQLWADEIKEKHPCFKETIDDIIKQEIGLVFERVLEDCGVFKQDEQGNAAIISWIEEVLYDN